MEGREGSDLRTVLQVRPHGSERVDAARKLAVSGRGDKIFVKEKQMEYGIEGELGVVGV